MVFHGLSRSGKAKGFLVYANYGSREDFKRLKDQGIDMTGSIALVRYYGSQGDRALKVKAAELAGAVACIIYSDPADDDLVMRNDTVQRGAVSLMSWVVGDVLSSGFASFPGEKRRTSLVIFLTHHASFDHVLGGRRPFQPTKTCLPTLEPP